MNRSGHSTAYDKKIYDPVYGFIRLSAGERELVDSYAFQRLHYIRQLGVAYLVYPGAVHSRFEHSLGVLEVATRIFDKISEYFPIEEAGYWRKIIRFSALCHDLGHLPFSHVAEAKILRNKGHEAWTLSVVRSGFLSPVWEKLAGEFPGKDPVVDIIKTCIGEEKLSCLLPEEQAFSFTPLERVISQIVTGDFFGADRIDYLLRDARCTGVSYGLFDYHQLIEMLRVLPTEGGGLELGVEENGIESCEALLLARHFMHKRVYHYPSVRAYSFHMARFMQGLYERDMPLFSVGKYLSYTDNEVLSELKKAFLDPLHEGHEDALPLFVKENRYIALELPEGCLESDITDWQTRFGIPDEAVSTSFVMRKERFSPSFPVQKGNLVVDARSCSDLRIPVPVHNWLYVSPKYRDALQGLPRKES